MMFKLDSEATQLGISSPKQKQHQNTNAYSKIYNDLLGRVAQLVEHHTVYVKVVGSSPIFFVYLVMLCETVYSLRTLNLLRKFRTKGFKFTWEVTSHCGIEDFLWRSATIHYIVMYTNGRICFCRISKKESMLNKNNLCKPAAKKDTIHNAVIKELYIGSRREVMGSYASFDAAYYSASTKIFRPW